MNELEKLFLINEEDKEKVFVKRNQLVVKSLIVRSKTEEEIEIDKDPNNLFTQGYGDGDIPVFTISLNNMKLTKKPNMRKLLLSLWQDKLPSSIPLTDKDIISKMLFESNNIAVNTRRGAGNLIIMSKDTLAHVQKSDLPVEWEYIDYHLLEIDDYVPNGYIIMMYCPINKNLSLSSALDRPIHVWYNGSKMNYGIIQDKVDNYISMFTLEEFACDR